MPAVLAAPKSNISPLIRLVEKKNSAGVNFTRTTFHKKFFTYHGFAATRIFARWTALFTGIVYGVTRYNYLSRREVEIQKHENEIRERHRIKMEQLRKQNEEAEMLALGKEAGVVAAK